MLNARLIYVRNKKLSTYIGDCFVLMSFGIRHIGRGGGGADSIRLQIVFFLNSVKDAEEPQSLVILPKL